MLVRLTPARLELVAATGVILAAGLLLAVEIVTVATDRAMVLGEPASDFETVRDAAGRWAAGQPFYLSEQRAGPYEWPGPWILYPPPMLLLFLPFTVLPAMLWWLIPLGVISAVVWHHRPRPLAWAIVALCAAYPSSISMVYWGNPGMWFVAAVAAATVLGWPAVVVFFKPTLAPFALIGLWRRSWWVALVVLVVISVPFLPLWLEYVVVAQNARTPNGLLYSIAQVPAMLLPVAALLGSRTHPPRVGRRSTALDEGVD